MRRTRRWLAGTVLGVGLALTGCAGDDIDPGPEEGVPSEEDPDGVDPGTGGIDEDDDTSTDEDGGEG